MTTEETMTKAAEVSELILDELRETRGYRRVCAVVREIVRDVMDGEPQRDND